MEWEQRQHDLNELESLLLAFAKRVLCLVKIEQLIYLTVNGKAFSIHSMFARTMFSLKYSVRALKSPVLIKLRQCSQFAEQSQSIFGNNGHYDIIIIGGGATGISLAGAIGKCDFML